MSAQCSLLLFNNSQFASHINQMQTVYVYRANVPEGFGVRFPQIPPLSDISISMEGSISYIENSLIDVLVFNAALSFKMAHKHMTSAQIGSSGLCHLADYGNNTNVSHNHSLVKRIIDLLWQAISETSCHYPHGRLCLDSSYAMWSTICIWCRKQSCICL